MCYSIIKIITVSSDIFWSSNDIVLPIVMSVVTIDRSLLVHLISELRILSSHERVSDVVKVERSQIWVSHNLANLARVNHQTVFWLGSGPDDILQILENDRLVTLAE